jgi:hypothetical protein
VISDNINNLRLSDDFLFSSDYVIDAYLHDKGKNDAYTYKHYPDKAVHLKIKDNKNKINIWLDPNDGKWKSSVIFKDKNVDSLKPEQMREFLSSKFYSKLTDKLIDSWPLKDNFFKKLAIYLKRKQFGYDVPELTSESIGEDVIFPGKMKLLDCESIEDDNDFTVNFSSGDKRYALSLCKFRNTEKGWRLANLDYGTVYADPTYTKAFIVALNNNPKPLGDLSTGFVKLFSLYSKPDYFKA